MGNFILKICSSDDNTIPVKKSNIKNNSYKRVIGRHYDTRYRVINREDVKHENEICSVWSP